MDNKVIQEFIDYNRQFVANRDYERYQAPKLPRKKTAIVTCMDTRLTELLTASMGIKNGDVCIIKIAGGIITNQYDTAVRSLLIAIYELGVTDIMVIGHTDCGARHLETDEIIKTMHDKGVDTAAPDIAKDLGTDLRQWLTGFEDTERAVRQTVSLISNHPLIHKGISVTGYIIDITTGGLTVLDGQPGTQAIAITHDKAAHRFKTTSDGIEAHVAYDIHDGALDIRHTIVPKEIGGRGIAAALVRAAYDYAVQQGLTPMATCSYALTWLKRHPEYKGIANNECEGGTCAI